MASMGRHAAEGMDEKPQDRVYCCQVPDTHIGGFSFLQYLQGKKRADERT
jgi:hypothetical protein